MQIAVGSRNVVKINAVIQGVAHMWPDAVVWGFDTDSGVGVQPRSDAETRQGSLNRAKRALDELLEEESPKKGETYIGIGLEGGVDHTLIGLMNVVWCSVIDTEGNSFSTSGARFVLPEIIASRILNGEEMGPIMDSLLKEKDTKMKQGMIGTISQGFYSRTDEYASIVRLTVGLWYGRNWQKDL